jgi:hypothetical protein
MSIQKKKKKKKKKKRKKKKKKKGAQSHSPAQRLRGMDDSCNILFNLFVS